MKKLALLSLTLVSVAAFGQLSEPNLVVTLVGNGGTNVAANTARVAIRQFSFNSSSSFTQVGSDIELPYLAAAAKKFTSQTGEQSEAQITLSSDGRFLTMLGYAGEEGLSNPGLDTATGFGMDRMFARIPSSGIPALGNAIKSGGVGSPTNSIPENRIPGDSARGAVLNGKDLYLSNGSGGVRLGIFGGSKFSPISDFINDVDQSPTSSRVLKIYNGNLYYSSSDDRNEAQGFFSNSLYGFSGIPTSLGVPAFLAGTNNSIRDFFFLNSTTLYVLSTSAGTASDPGSIMRFELQSGVWVKTAGTAFNGTASVIPSLNNFVYKDGFFYATRANGATILRIPLDLSSATVVATAPTGKLFRGIAFAPKATRSVTGSIDLGDNDFDGRYPITLEVLQAGNVVETTTVLAENGAYVLDTAVAPGAYQLLAKSTSWLSKTVNLVVNAGGGSSASFGTLLNGDLDGDNEVSILDYITLSTNYGAQNTELDSNEQGDLDGDGEVSILDYIILSTNYGQTGN